MSSSEIEAISSINVKQSAKKCQKFLFKGHSFYRRSMKTTGYSTFSCTQKQCKATISCKYSSYEAAMETDEEPEILR